MVELNLYGLKCVKCGFVIIENEGVKCDDYLSGIGLIWECPKCENHNKELFNYRLEQNSKVKKVKIKASKKKITPKSNINKHICQGLIDTKQFVLNQHNSEIDIILIDGEWYVRLIRTDNTMMHYEKIDTCAFCNTELKNIRGI